LKVRFIEGACRRDDTDQVSLPESGWLYDGYCLDISYPLIDEKFMDGRELNDHSAWGFRDADFLINEECGTGESLIPLENKRQTLQGQKLFNVIDCLRDIRN
jgi:hypothetical protein